MEYTISNEQISLTVSDIGAEMQSIKKDDVEYLWNGDKRYWKDRAPVLFPFVGRFTNGAYTINGKKYNMDIHGFAKDQSFKVVNVEKNKIELLLSDNQETRAIYPYQFDLSVTYSLVGNEIRTQYLVKNKTDSVMYFGLGSHPGFNVPLEDKLHFTDYCLEFSGKCIPERVGHTEACFLSGVDKKYDLCQGNRIELKHEMFDEDAIVLRNMSDCITLKSDLGHRKVTVRYPQCGYLGIWHLPKSDAPYVCIEPWTSLPSRQDVVEELRYKSDLIRLAPQDVYKNEWEIIIE